MEKEKKERIAAFRFRVIADLVGESRLTPDEFRRLIEQKAKRCWEIPHSTSDSISESTICRWLKIYESEGCQTPKSLPYIPRSASTSTTVGPLMWRPARLSF